MISTIPKQDMFIALHAKMNTPEDNEMLDLINRAEAFRPSVIALTELWLVCIYLATIMLTNVGAASSQKQWRRTATYYGSPL